MGSAGDSRGVYRLTAAGWRLALLEPELLGLAPNLLPRARDVAMWLYFEGLPLMRWADGRLVRYGLARRLAVGAVAYASPPAVRHTSAHVFRGVEATP